MCGFIAQLLTKAKVQKISCDQLSVNMATRQMFVTRDLVWPVTNYKVVKRAKPVSGARVTGRVKMAESSQVLVQNCCYKKTEVSETRGARQKSSDKVATAGNEFWYLCGGPESGNMIACDNPGCPIEWLHLECVGLVDAPSGKWLCTECAV